MMGIFTRDATASLAKARDQLAAAETRAAALRAEREVALLQYETIDEVARIEGQISAQERAAKIYVDRIAALSGERRRQEHQRRQQEWSATVAGIERRLAARAKIAADLEAALAVVRKKQNSLLDATRALIESWPIIPNMAALDVAAIQGRVAWILYRMGQTHLKPPPAASFGGDDLEDFVAERAARLLADLRSHQIEDEPEAEPEDNEAAQEQAA